MGKSNLNLNSTEPLRQPSRFSLVVNSRPVAAWHRLSLHVRLLLVVAFASSLVRIVGLASVREVIFDEVHFGKFATAYCCSHERTFDIHPPHAKLLIAGAARLFGYRGGFSFSRIGLAFPDTLPVFGFRLIPSLAGVGIVIVFFFFLQQLGASQYGAFAGALCLALDNLFVTQTRVIGLDGILLLAQLSSLSIYLASYRRKGVSFFGLTLAAGAMAGLAAGSKFTGIAILPVIAFHAAVFCWHAGSVEQWKRSGFQAVLFIFAFSIVYLLGWVAHFHLLYLPGFGDSFYQLKGNFFSDLVTVHRTMFDANFGLKSPHQDASPWWSWPLMKVPVFYWAGPGRSLYLIGNPVVWWGSTLIFVGMLARGLFYLEFASKKEMKALFGTPVCLVLVAYFVSVLPFLGIPRALFIYHYMTPLLFSLAFVVLSLDRNRFFTPRNTAVLGAVVALLFIALSPLSYGFQSGAYGQFLVDTIRSWR